MKTIKCFLIIITLILVGCSKEEINMEYLVGNWTVSVVNTNIVCLDTSKTYSFSEDGRISIKSWDFLTNSWSASEGQYWLNGHIIGVQWNPREREDGTIWTKPYKEYVIVKLTKDVMEWQEVGTVYDPKDELITYFHYVRSRIQ